MLCLLPGPKRLRSKSTGSEEKEKKRRDVCREGRHACLLSICLGLVLDHISDDDRGAERRSRKEGGGGEEAKTVGGVEERRWGGRIGIG